ncbi:polyketide synthase dehydratase domain-containing protein [Frigoriglobus tundricola]|uniref:PKS/mFAS DH domain-containing protein n=1 Tax=Frigoriglobus tundricola TaxID=2774151 RepID=A0A6M5YKT4_9BACT|nr:polyketide synthase dehydratase domain-containing protein [Frigoriglobus tundricola]QJW93893.1 hypothetical protein FTUN_1407 [Frigoriglobus tundricola]
MPSTLTEPPPRSAPPAIGWDTELFVLRGDDRAMLGASARALAAAVEEQPGAGLADLAALLGAEMKPGGARLAVVAGSRTDLVARLSRAADRLADPKCKQIRDANGIYYFDSPLTQQGTVALLFPGEGAQYLNMLADLCGVFPEVEETFAWCDRLAEEAGRPESSLRRVLHLPPDATAGDRAAAEAELRGLGPSIFGVLLADQAIFRVIQNLQVPVSAMAGHSAGELGALLASGAMRSQDQHGSRLPEIMEIMQRQESTAGGPDVALLAVGAGRVAVEEAATAVAGGAVVVAMDNCPHQCVAVGPTHLVAAVESALTEKGVISERLPFKRPYHTPLFEPYMGALRELFVDVPFVPPTAPVYSCSTGALFPTDPDAVRQLAVNHWVSPVEFTRMIETMHADGVRVFVECGPRGNLSAFVEDILRGKPFAAVPANLPRKSGPTQINHMVAQLVAHGVDLNLGHLYEGRRPAPPAPLPSHGTVSGASRGPEEGRGEKDRRNTVAFAESEEASRAVTPFPLGRGAGGVGPSAVVHAYLDVMEQFLDTQRAVMTAFLSGHPAPEALPSELFAALDFALPGSDQADAAPVAQLPEADKPLCLLGAIVRHEPGREIVFRRVMDEHEDLYVDDHTLGGRGVSRVEPSQNGLPVLPMTFSLEAMAQAAQLLAPGKVVVAIRNVRMLRWLPFDPEPTTLEVRAAVTLADPETGVVEVKADVRDLGNIFVRDGANKAACDAIVVLADQFPEPPDPLPFALTAEQPCRSTVEDLRRNMFHGPLFQMIRSLGRTGREGIEGTLEVQGRDRWFRSDPDPRVAIDPVLVDAAMHILGAWHLEQPDWSGRILLPIGVNRIDFFGPIPPVGALLKLRGHNEEETARQVRHGVELFAPDGRLWFRMTGASYWRFYLPFGDVNFFGPKDQYYLSTRCPAAEPTTAARSPRCYFLDPPADLQQPVLRASGVRVTMTPREISEFNAWTGTDSARSNWFFGRLVAKDTVRAAWGDRYGSGIFPADIETHEVDGRIVCTPRGEPGPEPFPSVAVAISEGKVAAFAAYAERVGCALQAIPKNAAVDAERAVRAQVACAAVADALRVPVESCTMEALDAGSGAAVVSTNGQRFRVQTGRQKDAVVATTMCEGA